MGIGANEVADQSTKRGFSHPPAGTEPALSILVAEVARGVIRALKSMKHEEYWQSICGPRQTMDIIERSGDLHQQSQGF